MTTPPDEPLSDALDRADAALPARRLDARTCPPELLGRLVRHPVPSVRHLGLTLLTERADTPDASGPGGGHLALLESQLPHTVGSSPEESLLLAGLHARLGSRKPHHRLPNWRAAELPARVRIAWLRTELLGDPAVLRTEPAGELLYRAVRESAATGAHRPDRLVAELVDTGDPVLQAEALRLAREGLHAGLLAPAFVRDRLLRLLDAPDADVVTGALHELAEPWATVTPVARPLLPRSTGAVAAAGLVAAARHGHHAVLWNTAEDPAGAPALRRQAVELLGERAERTDVGRLVALAATDPLLLAGPVLACLRGLHRRGHFPADRDVGPILDLALADHTLPAEDVATVLYTCRRPLSDALTSAPPTSSDWPRRLELLVALERQGVTDIPIGETVARLLPAARAPRPFLAAIRALHPANAEDVVLALLPTAASVALHTLEAIGGDRTRSALARAFGVDASVAPSGLAPDDPAEAPDSPSRAPGSPPPVPGGRVRAPGSPSPVQGGPVLAPGSPSLAADGSVLAPGSPSPALGGRPPGLGSPSPAPGGRPPAPGSPPPTLDARPPAPDRSPHLPVAPELAPVRDRALALLWHLTREPEQRRALLDRLDPQHLPYAIEADLGAPDERELAVLRARVDADAPVAALRRIAEYAGTEALTLVSDLLLRIVRDLAAPRDPDAGPPWPGADTPYPDPVPAGEPELPAEALEAVRAFGSRLWRRRRIRPVCLLDAPDDTGAGHAFLTATVLGLLERPGLTGGEQAVLLKALLQAPATASTRARVHRLLRSRDPHVRKHVIALLAHDASGADARALSATLVPLTSDPDIRTVRAALLALGTARADWAGEAVAACLHHPNMNIRKTAAATLLHAGAPAAVPHLLRALGRDDNPGLRTALTRALGAVVGDARTATLLAAAEAARNERTRRLLLRALDGEVTARAVLALDAGASPVVPALLALVANGGVRLAAGSGSVADLAEALARHGVPMPPDAPGGATAGGDPDVTALLRTGWDPGLALRIARRPTPPDTADVRELPAARAMLGPWLDLAAVTDEAGLRSRLVRCALRLCPGPWSAEETAVLARHSGTVADAFCTATGEGGTAGFGGELIDVLHAVAPHVSAGRRFPVIEALRALPPAGFGGSPRPEAAASTLSLLRGFGAVLVRADLDRALAAAHEGADPWRAAPAVLREAFGVPGEGVIADEPAEWRAELAEAVRTPEALAEFRGRYSAAGTGTPHAPGTEGTARTEEGVSPPPIPPRSRHLLHALVEAYPGATPQVRARLVDWMTQLQPLDAPEWTIAETWAASATAGAPVRPARADDLDQPRSAAQRSRLLAMLDAESPERRTAAALALRDWPEPDVSRAVLRAYLRGRVEVLPDRAYQRGRIDVLPDRAHPRGRDDIRPMLAALTSPNPVHGGELTAPEVLPERALRLVAQLPEDDLPPLVPLLVEWWEHGPPAVHTAARTALRRVPADALAHLLAPRIEAGDRGLLDLLTGLRLLRTPTLTRAERLLRTEGREALADGLVLLDGPLRTPGTAPEGAAALASLRTPSRVPAAPADPLSLPELLDLARTGTPARIREILTRLVDEYAPGPGARPDPELPALVEELLRHPRAGVRLHAHRASRALFDRDTHARLTVLLLSDPLPDVVRRAVRTLGRAAWEPALPELVRLLDHAKPAVRRAARDAVAGFGGAAVPALRRAEAHARPDRRSLYTDVLAEIADGGP